MATASVTIELDLPDGVEIREYQRHGDGHAFHVAWPPPDRCRCDGCTQEGPTRLDCKATFYVVRDLDLWGQPSFWVYQPPLHHCPHCGRRQHLLPPFKRRDVTYTYRFERHVLACLIGSTEEEVAQRLRISAETVALIVTNQIADQEAKQVAPGRVIRRIGLDEISLKKRHKLYATILTDLTDPTRPEVLAVAAGRDRAAAETCLRKLSEAQRQAVATHCPDMSPAYLSACADRLPNSQSVIDRFHVAKNLGEVADALRKSDARLQAGTEQGAAEAIPGADVGVPPSAADLMAEPAEALEALFQEVPALRVIYQLRWKLTGIFDEAADRGTAAAEIAAWCAEASASGQDWGAFVGQAEKRPRLRRECATQSRSR